MQVEKVVDIYWKTLCLQLRILNYKYCALKKVLSMDLMLCSYYKNNKNNNSNKNAPGYFGDDNTSITLTAVFHKYMQMFKLIKWHTLSMCSFCIPIIPK